MSKKMPKKVVKALEAAEQVLKGGRHFGPCVYENPGIPAGLPERGACLVHLATSERREAKLRAALDAVWEQED